MLTLEKKDNQGGFGFRAFTDEEEHRIAQQLKNKLDKEDLSIRPGPSGTKLYYVEAKKAIELANETFGYSGWACNVIRLELDYAETTPQGRYNVGFTAIVRVTLQDGTFHEDCGFGQAEGFKQKGLAIQKAKKEAVTDARKRALRLFGNGLGNCIYDKEHLKNLKSYVKPEVTNFTRPDAVGGYSASPPSTPAQGSGPPPPLRLRQEAQPQAPPSKVHRQALQPLPQQANVQGGRQQRPPPQQKPSRPLATAGVSTPSPPTPTDDVCADFDAELLQLLDAEPVVEAPTTAAAAARTPAPKANAPTAPAKSGLAAPGRKCANTSTHSAKPAGTPSAAPPPGGARNFREMLNYAAPSNDPYAGDDDYLDDVFASLEEPPSKKMRVI